MTRDEVLAMAEQAGAVTYSPPPMRAVRGLSFEFDQLERFAAIVAAAEREELIKQGWKSPGLKKQAAVDALKNIARCQCLESHPDYCPVHAA